ncbi:hypothetical protein [Aliagarivorans marinus]|uniref:hypothetical protein n=1 Tax=Aliagarivorans marinus TaxID=561965 RepID=UPI000425D563|nr:hypothetical protein [Aliagarivorans marinus]
MEQYKKYLPWLLLLVLAKFAWMPVIENRNSTMLERNSVVSQVARTQDVIDNSTAYIARKQQLQDSVSELESNFVEFDNPSEFRLDFQRYLESLKSGYDVTIESMNWFEPISEGRVIWFGLEVSLSGAVDDIAAFHRSLNSNSGVSISSLNWRVRSTRGSEWQWNVRSQYRLDIPVIAGEQE